MNKIYFVGIKGVGMASLAIIAKQAGIDVIGSDVDEEFITDTILRKENIQILKGFSEKNFDNFIQDTPQEKSLVITTSAHGGMENIESKHAKNRNFQVITHGQAVGLFMRGKIFNRDNIKGISIAGCHGKTTISSMLSTYMMNLGFDPSYTVGTSEIVPLGASGHYGKGEYFIAEADEYVSDINYDRVSKILYQYPKFAIINNIDFDHPDFYKDINEVEETYIKFIDNIDGNGVLLVNGDDSRAKTLSQKCGYSGLAITYGANPDNDYFISKYSQDEFKSYFSVESKNIYLGDFTLSVPGFHNAKNSLSTIALLLELGVSISKISKVLPLYIGTKRRIEYIGKTDKGTVLLDDYAHHPQEIKTTLSAVKNIYPRKKIICIFQPHTYSRTKALRNDFVTAFHDTAQLLLLPIFASAREKEPDDFDFEQFLSEFKKINNNIQFFKHKDIMIEYISKNFNSNEYVILTMGAGDVYKIGKTLISISNKI